MNTLLFNFIVDKSAKTIKVEREFRASQDKVWSAWTEAEFLDKWWAPKPWQSRTKSMHFSEGGQRLYAMVGPDGEEHWALADYTSITPKDQFKFLDAFSDSEGNINTDFPRSDWTVNFKANSGITTVHVNIKHEKLEDLEKIIEMGFKEGFTTTLDYLAEIL